MLGLTPYKLVSYHIFFLFHSSENHRLQSAYDNHLIVKLILVSNIITSLTFIQFKVHLR